MPAAIFDPALCLRHWDWSETSQVVALFTRSHGVIRALAKGARRPGSPYSGGLEVLTAGEAGLILKPAADLHLLTEWDLRQPFNHLRASLPVYHAGLYIADLLSHMVIDADPHESLFDDAITALHALRAGPDSVPGVLLRLQWSALTESGYQPDFDLAAAGPSSFDPASGTLIKGSPPNTWPLRPQTVALVRALKDLPKDRPSKAPAPVVRNASRFLATYLAWLIGRPLNTAPLVYPDLPKAITSSGSTDRAAR
ncbi:MAG: DNA repair protein RecO [Phycisphaerales bacterium]|nr:DNA repair protein RecO [Phycisphaerales bacterium]